MLITGQQLDHYRLVRLLGSGGMGDVYLAEDARIEQQVAIKLIRSEIGPYPNGQTAQDAARLFQREAKAIAKLDHPHILPLFAYGEQQVGNMSLVYLVMPYRQEGSLADWLRNRGREEPLTSWEVAHFVGQAASALQHAHDRQIIHQDVKPSNFLLRYRAESPTRPDLLLTDFGIAHFSAATSTVSQSIRGTPTAMAPEQWEGHPLPASDQYALAVMAYELLTGRPPFQGAPGHLLYLHLTMPPPPPSTFNPRLPKDIDTVLLHALAKRPERRFASITAFARAFQQTGQNTEEIDAVRLETAINLPANPGDIQAELAISTAEAQTGTSRTLTLPRGRSVRVLLPPGVQDGSVLRLDGQGEVSPVGAGALILTILVKHEEALPRRFTGSAFGVDDGTLSQPSVEPTNDTYTAGVDDGTLSQPSVEPTNDTHTADDMRIEQVPKPPSPSWYRRIFALLVGTLPLAVLSIWLVKSLVAAPDHTMNSSVLALSLGVFLAVPFIGGLTTLALSGRTEGGGFGCLSGILFGLIFFVVAFWDASLSRLGVGYILSQNAPILIMGTLFFGFLSYLGACTYIGIRRAWKKGR